MSLGNVGAHAIFFSVKGRTWYNPGLATALLLFVPVAPGYGYLLVRHHPAGPYDWLFGLSLGLALQYYGILKPIDWLVNPATLFRFATRQLRPVDRQ